MSTLDKKISELPAVDIGTLTGAERFEIIWSDGSSWFNQAMRLEDLVTILTSVLGGLPGGSDYQVLQLDGSGNPTFGNQLNDSYGALSIDFFERVVYDDVGRPAFTYANGNKGIYSDGGEIAFNLSTRTVYDDFGHPAMYFNIGIRQLLDGSGNWSYDYGSRTFNDSIGYLALDHENRQAFNNTGSVAVLDWDAHTLTDIGNMLSVNWGSRHLYDQYGHLSSDYNARQHYDALGLLADDHNLREHYDTSGVRVWNYGFRQLNDESGVEVLNWINGFQLTTGYPWAFNGASPSATDTGWTSGGVMYTPLKTFPSTSVATTTDLGNMLVTLIRELISKGILAY